MIDIHSFLILVARLSLCSGIVAYFLHWCIGSPEGISGEHNIFKVNTGRIFSKYGIWVIKRFNLREESENKRIEGVFDKRAKVLSDKYKELISERVNSPNAEDIDEEVQQLQNELLTELSYLKGKVQLYRRRNPYKAAGACLTCFSSWISGLCFLGYFLAGILLIQKVTFIFLIPAIAASALIAKLIHKILK